MIDPEWTKTLVGAARGIHAGRLTFVGRAGESESFGARRIFDIGCLFSRERGSAESPFILSGMLPTAGFRLSVNAVLSADFLEPEIFYALVI